jgi:hypothetical protein
VPICFPREVNPCEANSPEPMHVRGVLAGRLMEIAPPGTIDPSPYLYDTTMQVRTHVRVRVHACMQVGAFV